LSRNFQILYLQIDVQAIQVNQLKQCMNLTIMATKKNSITKPNPNQKIEHVTIIDAPIQTVWKALVDVNDWSWNKWTRLEAGAPAVGLKGTLRACYEGNDQDWQTFPFEFAEVDPDHHVLAWKGSVLGGCLFKGHHTMRLEKFGSSEKAPKTKLIHTEVFGGILPKIHLGLPYTKLERNYRLMNESLKEFVESKQE